MTKDWIDRNEYPWTGKYIETPGGRMHYLDEGRGEPVVMVHGNPTWSFLYRHFIRELTGSYRCIVPDHIGFGLSDKPANWTYYSRDHAHNLEILLDSLNLKNITLVVQDWGGPIGLSYAIKHPGRIKKLVIMNTWLWAAQGDPHFERFSSVMGGPIGKFLTRNFNFFARTLMKTAFVKKSLLTKKIHRHYIKPLNTKESRKGSYVFPEQIIGAGDWLQELWEEAHRIRNKPTLIIWGLGDTAFRESELSRWIGFLRNVELHTFPHIGHYVQEELGPEAAELTRDFLDKPDPRYRQGGRHDESEGDEPREKGSRSRSGRGARQSHQKRGDSQGNQSREDTRGARKKTARKKTGADRKTNQPRKKNGKKSSSASVGRRRPRPGA